MQRKHRNLDQMADKRHALALAMSLGGTAMIGRTRAILAVIDEFCVLSDAFGEECIKSVITDMLAAAYVQGFMQSENAIDELQPDAERYAWLRDGGIHKFGSTLSGDELDKHIDDQLDDEEEADAKAGEP